MPSEFHIDYGSICHLYAQKQLTGTLYLAFRDIPQILQRYSLLNRQSCVAALDFGCGTGVSTRYLQSLRCLFKHGIDIQGVDVSADMLNLARQADPHGSYILLYNHHIPFPHASYDFIFSSFVLFEFATKEQMQQTLQEIKRIMKKDAIFIAVTGSADAYKRDNQWVSLRVDFPQNDQLRSGDLGRVDFVMNDQTLTFQNYYWTEKDYQDVFQAAGLSLCETLHPLGNKHEETMLSWQWKSETTLSPYYIFVLKSS
jgi:SAM-dependent methyltransferase